VVFQVGTNVSEENNVSAFRAEGENSAFLRKVGVSVYLQDHMAFLQG
jgi:hypothetical protein